MIPAITAVRMSGAAHRAELPLLVLGPSLGTTAATLWTYAAEDLTDAFDVLAWDLPGHGHNRSVPDEGFTMAELAQGVLRVVDDVLEQRGEAKGHFAYAGDSVGGCVGLQLLLDAPGRVEAAVLLATGARIGELSFWAERIERVRASGTAAMVAASAERWFAPDFLDRHPTVGSDLLVTLQETSDAGYVRVCEAVAGFDVRHRLGEIAAPVLAVAGAVDAATPMALLEEIADGVADGRLVVLPDVAHLPPAEVPETVARLVRQHLLGEEAPSVAAVAPDRPGRYDDGRQLRQQVLGDDDGAAGFSRDFEDLVTEYAWGEVWSRPGLDRRDRSLITLAALVARGHREELAAHVRGALRNGVTVEELQELFLQLAVDCGVHDARAGLGIALEVLAEGE
jgi:3-oxoadipate enol-lactonase/4-carboxymuconolactone decarboxylase